MPTTPRMSERMSSRTSKRFATEEDKETINSLQREQERLAEELATEKKRSENLKELYTKDLNFTTAMQRDIFTKLRLILSKRGGKDPHVLEALRLIGEYEMQEGAFIPDTPRVTELANQAKEADVNSEKLERDVKALKRSYKQNHSEIETLKQQVSEAEENLQSLKESRQEIKEKLQAFVEKCKKREASWKDKVAALEAQLEAQS